MRLAILSLCFFCFLATPLYPQGTGICIRTPDVQTAILGLLPPGTACSAVTVDQLAGITGTLTADGISPTSGDFSGLTGITALNLRDGTFATLPSGIFSDLVSVESIRLQGRGGNISALQTLPGDIFSGLTSLETLNIGSCSLTALPSDLFEGLESLGEVRMSNNAGLAGVRIPVRLIVDVLSTLTRLDLPPDVVHEVSLIADADFRSEGGASVPLRVVSTYSGGFAASISAAGTATQGTDYTLASSINVAPNTWQGSTLINPARDSLVEGEETVTVSLTGLTGTGTATIVLYDFTSSALGTPMASVALRDGVPLAYLEADPLIVNEGDTFTLSIRLTEPLDGDVSLPLRTGPAYFSQTTGLYFDSGNFDDASVIIPAGEILETRVIRAIDDSNAELDQVVSVEFDISRSTSGFNLDQVDPGDPISLEITIPANDLEVRLSISTVTMNEGGRARVFVTGTGGRKLRATFQVEAGSSASLGGDFTLTATTVEIPRPSLAGEQPFASLDIVGITDSVSEGDEVVTLRLTGIEINTGTESVPSFSATSFNALPSDSVTVTISESAPNLPIATLSADELTRAEGEETLLSVTLDVTSTSAVTIDLGVVPGGTATFTGGAGTADDFGFPDGRVITIAAGDTVGTLRLEILTDDPSNVELTEEFSVQFERISGVVEGDPSSVDLQIRPDPPDIRFQAVAQSNFVPEWGGSIDFLMGSSSPNTVLYLEPLPSSTATYGGMDADYEFVAGAGTVVVDPVMPGDNPQLVVTLATDEFVGGFSIRSLIDQDYSEPTDNANAERVILRIVRVEVENVLVSLPPDRRRTIVFLESLVGVSITSGGLGGIEPVEVRGGDSSTITYTLTSDQGGTCILPPRNRLLGAYPSFTEENPGFRVGPTRDDVGGLAGIPVDRYPTLWDLTPRNPEWQASIDYYFPPDTDTRDIWIEYDLPADGDPDADRLVDCSGDLEIEFPGGGETSAGTRVIQVGLSRAYRNGLTLAPSTPVVHFVVLATLPALSLSLSPLEVPENGGVATLDFQLTFRQRFNFTIGQISGTATAPGEANADYTLSQTRFSFSAIPVGDSALRQGSITITAVDDNLREPALEDLELAMISSEIILFFGNRYTSDPITDVPGSTATLQIADDDLPSVTLQAPPDLVSWEDGRPSPTLPPPGDIEAFTMPYNRFGVVLGANPIGTTTVEVCMNAVAIAPGTAQGSPSPSCLTFDETDWNTPQFVTMGSNNDNIDEGTSDADGRRPYRVEFDLTGSTDSGYSTLSPPSPLTVNDIDDDTAGISLSGIMTMMTTSEDSSSPDHEASFSIKLESEPTADVSITITSSSDDEGRLRLSGGSPTPMAVLTLTFTPSSWGIQTVVVSGWDDDVDDGDQMYDLSLAVASSDLLYAAISLNDITGITNLDDDTAGIEYAAAPPTPGGKGSSAANRLITSETSGGLPADTKTFSLRLTSEPTDMVTLQVTSDDTTQGTVSPDPFSVAFTASDWDNWKAVTVTGVNDDFVDAMAMTAYTLTVTVAAGTTEAVYSNPSLVPDLLVYAQHDDDDTAGITITPTTNMGSRLVTSEDGMVNPASVNFEIVLDSQPSSDVTLTVTSADTGEGTVSPPPDQDDALSVVFTPTNWNIHQTVTITGVDDDVVDGDVDYQITVEVATTSDSNYASLTQQIVYAQNTDEDIAGFQIAPVTSMSSPLLTAETASGMPASVVTFTVKLDTQPAASRTVVLVVTSGAVAEGLVSADPADTPTSFISLTFDDTDWSADKTVYITSVDDSLVDGDMNYEVTVSVDAMNTDDDNYDPLSDQRVFVRNQDNDTPGVTVQVTGSAGPVTTEDGGSTTFTVILNSRPTGNVFIILALPSPGPSEADISPTNLNFPQDDWNVEQTVTVTGKDDYVVDGDIAYTVTFQGTSADSDYNANPIRSALDLTNNDDDTAGIEYAAAPPTTGGEGSSAANPLITSETSGVSPADTKTFSLRLTSEPTDTVTLQVTSGDTTQGTVSPDPFSVAFSSSDWNSWKAVTVTGVNDDFVDTMAMTEYTLTVTVAAATTESVYSDSSQVPDLLVYARHDDDDTAGISISPPTTDMGFRLVTSEDGMADPASVNFEIVLDSQPSSSVTLTVTSADTGEGTVSPSPNQNDPLSVVFTPANWDRRQEVTITAVDDDMVDGDVDYQITVVVAMSSDSNYAGLLQQIVYARNTDEDVAGLVITPASSAAMPLLTSEDGGGNPASVDFVIVLATRPSSNVELTVTSGDTGEGTVSDPPDTDAPLMLTFMPGTWDTAQTVTITSVDDSLVDGNMDYEVTVDVSMSSDTNYDALSDELVFVRNTDEDQGSIVIDPTGPLNTVEGGSTETVMVRLGAQPASSVVVEVTSDDPGEGSVSPATLTFLPSNWNVDQPVTITPEDDDLIDGNVAYDVSFTIDEALSPSGFRGLMAPALPTLRVTNEDNDRAGLEVMLVSGELPETTEEGGDTRFTMRLVSTPTDVVTVLMFLIVPNSVTSLGGTPPRADFTSRVDDTTEGQIVGASALIFTTLDPSMDTSWGKSVTITIEGLDDSVVDGNAQYEVAFQVSSADGNYDNLYHTPLALTNTDDDTADLMLALVGSPTVELDTSTTPLRTLEEPGSDAQTFTVRLSSQPVNNVVVLLGVSGDTDEGEVTPSMFTFNSGNWDNPRTVTVQGRNDDLIDGDKSYQIDITTDNAQTLDDNFDLASAVVMFVNEDDDGAAIQVTPTSRTFTITEGTSQDIRISLSAIPTSAVILSISDPGSEGDIASATDTDSGAGIVALTFDNSNWNTPQVLEVTATDDSVADGTTQFVVEAAVATTDTDFGMIASPVTLATVNVADNDSADLAVTRIIPAGGSRSGEDGTSFSFSVSLQTQPLAEVTVTVSTDNALEASAESTGDTDGDGDPLTVQLVFTPPSSGVTGTWNTAQTVTIRGVNDDIADGDQTFNVLFTAISTDSAYNADFSGNNFEATNDDDDTAGVRVSPPSSSSAPLDTSESGGFQEVRIRLETQPPPGGSDVVVTLSFDSSEADVTPATLTFTSAPTGTLRSWADEQTVTVSGKRDFSIDGDQEYQITLSVNAASDARYINIPSGDLPVIFIRNLDADTAELDVSIPVGADRDPDSGRLLTREADPTRTVALGLKLSSQPTNDVVVTLSIVNPATNMPITGEGNIETGSTLTFTNAASGTTGSWADEQEVVIAGVDDLRVDGNVDYDLTFSITSSDTNYNAISVSAVEFTNVDNDTAEVLVDIPVGADVNSAGRIRTQESDTSKTATFSVKLQSEPASQVTISLRFVDPSTGDVITDEAEFDATTILPLVFTSAASPDPNSWEVEHQVVIHGLDERIVDGNTDYDVVFTITGDALYASLTVSPVQLVNEDDDSVDVTLIGTDDVLETSESGTTASFRVELGSKPLNDVIVTIMGNPIGEGLLSASSLTFTNADAALGTPVADPATPGPWNRAQMVTITGVDDDFDDGDIDYLITFSVTSADVNYGSLSSSMLDEVAARNTDDDDTGIEVDISGGTGLRTSEDERETTFRLRLTSRPRSDVTISLTLVDPSTATNDPVTGLPDYYTATLEPGEMSITTSTTLTFTTDSPTPGDSAVSWWREFIEVTLRGVNDDEADGNIPVRLVFTFSDADATYDSSLKVEALEIINDDNDSPNIVFGGTDNLFTHESGAPEATFTVKLSTRPSADVALTASSTNSDEGTVSSPTGSLTFNNLDSGDPGSWADEQTITVTGVDDVKDDGDVVYSVSFTTTSTDVGYATPDLVIPEVTITNQDDDDPDFIFGGIPSTGLVTSEDPGVPAVTFNIRLATEPSSDITIEVHVSDPSEGTVSPVSLTFTSATADSSDPAAISPTDSTTPGPWNRPRIVTLEGEDDSEQDTISAMSYQVVFEVTSTTSDTSYRGMMESLDVTNLEDDDMAGIGLNPVGPFATHEDASEPKVFFTVQLTSQPTSDVTLNLNVVDEFDVADDTEGLPDPSTLVFSPGSSGSAMSWEDGQLVTLSGVDDFEVDGTVNYRIVISVDAGLTTDVIYTALSPVVVAATNADNDTYAVVVMQAEDPLITSEGYPSYHRRVHGKPLGPSLPRSYHRAGKLRNERGDGFSPYPHLHHRYRRQRGHRACRSGCGPLESSAASDRDRGGRFCGRRRSVLRDHLRSFFPRFELRNDFCHSCEGSKHRQRPSSSSHY